MQSEPEVDEPYWSATTRHVLDHLSRGHMGDRTPGSRWPLVGPCVATEGDNHDVYPTDNADAKSPKLRSSPTIEFWLKLRDGS